jgi:hypothetical protein
VNPSPVKGLALALHVARLLPQREFLFLESWPLSRAARAELRREISSLPNVRFQARTRDIASVYAQTALLLIPSQVEEAFGRVAIEAGANGIPQVASRIGGLPEAVGRGGVVLAAEDPPEVWAHVVDRIMSDPHTYRMLASRARDHSSADRFAVDRVGSKFLAVAERLSNLVFADGDLAPHHTSVPHAYSRGWVCLRRRLARLPANQAELRAPAGLRRCMTLGKRVRQGMMRFKARPWERHVFGKHTYKVIK